MASQKLELRASEIRQRLNEISGLEGDALTDEIRSEADRLQAEYRDVETKRRAAIVAEDAETREAEGDGGRAEDPEERERRELREKARVGEFIRAAMTGRPVRGASGEFADAVGCAGLLPLDLLEDRREDRAITPGPPDETVTSTRPTVPHAFARSDAAALGISMPTVPSGEAHYPALTTAPPAGMKAEDAAADATAGAFTLTKRTPGRITGQFEVRIEDVALMPSMEMDLRSAIAGAMSDALDDQVIDGDGAAPNLSGLFHQATDVNAANAKETFATGVSRFAALVDGKHANGWGDIRALIGTNTFALYASLFQSNGDMSLYDYLMTKLGLLRVSTRVPAVDSQAQKGIALRMAQGQPVTVPVWRGVELIVDPYTGAGTGKRIVTAVSLVGSPFIPYGASQAVEVHPKLS